MAELSRKNAATLALYYEAQACHGIDCDSLLRRNLGVIHGILEANRRGREKAMLELLAVLRVR